MTPTHSPPKRLVAAEEWSSDVGPDAWMGNMAPMFHRGQGMPWSSPDELLGLCQRPWAVHRVTGDARILLSEMSHSQGLCVMGSNVHGGVGNRASGCHVAFAWPSFLAQWGPSILSLDFSFFLLFVDIFPAL